MGVVSIVTGCSSESSSDPGILDNTARPGDPAVYARIDSSSNCTALQEEFNIAAGNTDRLQDAGDDAGIPLSYMEAADIRMREVGCYG